MRVLYEKMAGVLFLAALALCIIILSYSVGAAKHWLRGLGKPASAEVTSAPRKMSDSETIATLREEVDQLRTEYYKEYITTLRLNSTGFRPLRTSIGNFTVSVDGVHRDGDLLYVIFNLGNPHNATVSDATLLMSFQRQGAAPMRCQQKVDLLKAGGKWGFGYVFNPKDGVTENTTVQVALKLGKITFPR